MSAAKKVTIEDDAKVLREATDRVIRSATRHALVSQWLFSHAELLAKYSWDMRDKDYVACYTSEYSVTLTCYGDNAKDTMRTLRRELGGLWKKQAYGDTFTIEQEVGAKSVNFTLRIQGDREKICTRVVTGTEVKTIPAVEAKPERTETVEVVEWDCGSLLDDTPQG